jgi:hypothetical protein
MRIGTISFTTIDNYGAILQAYALSKVLERKGDQVSVINYQLPHSKLRDWLHVMHLSYIPHAPGTVACGVPRLPVRFVHLDQFRKKYLNRTRPAWTDDELKEISGQFDTLVTGSDEIFRTDRQGNIFPPLFLDFADTQRQNLHAYAASSAGTTDYGDKNAAVAKLLNRFDSISVRDDGTRMLVKKLTGMDPRIVLDPTLLWEFDELPLPEPPAQNYVLVYGFFRSPQTDRMVREVADRLGSSVVTVGWASKYAHHNLMTADMLQWLSCFKHARLVFTNCYHGLMFSTRYQRDFLVFESDKARLKLNDFIRRFSLSSRLLPSGEQPSPKQLEGMDHAALQNSLKPYTDDSIKYIELIGQHRESKKTTVPSKEGLEFWVINNDQATGQIPGAQQQLETVGVQLVHLFWEAVMESLTSPPLKIQLRRNWQAALAGILMFAAVLWLHLYSNAHLIFLPLYLLPCAWLSTKVSPRLGVIATLAAAFSGTLVPHYADPDFKSWGLMTWNIIMLFITIHFIISLLSRLYQEKHSAGHCKTSVQNSLRAGLKHHWAVIVAGGILFTVVVFMQAHASSNLAFMPLYLIPCLMIALVAGWGWGSIMAILCAVAGPLVQSLNDPDYQPWSVMIWNMLMRFIIFQVVVLLLNFTHLKKRFSTARSSRTV